MYAYTIDVVRMKEKKATGNRRQAVRQRIEENKWSYFPFFLYTMPHTMAVTNPLLFIIAYMFILFCFVLFIAFGFVIHILSSSHLSTAMIQDFILFFFFHSFFLFRLDSTRLALFRFFLLDRTLFPATNPNWISHRKVMCGGFYRACSVCLECGNHI